MSMLNIIFNIDIDCESLCEYGQNITNGIFRAVVWLDECLVFKPPPPVGAGGGYMFSGHPSVRPSVIHVVVLCFRDISSIC